jgi:hypothetical protein
MISEELLRVKLLDAKRAEVELRAVRKELELTTGASTDSAAATADSAAASDEHAASTGRLSGALSGLKSALVYGGGLIGLAGVGYGLKDVVQGGQQSQEQMLLLKNALKATGQEGAGHLNRLNKAISQSGTTGGFSKLEETQGIAELVRETQSSTAAIKDNASAVTLARGAHESYAAALSQVEKVQTGSVGRLQKLVGPFVASKYYIDQLTASEKKRFPQKVKDAELLDKEATAREFNRRILERYGSAVTSYNKSTAGAISNANNAFKNATEQLGEKLLPAEKAVAQWFGKLVTEITKGEGPWKTVEKDIKKAWEALEGMYHFLDGHKELAKLLGFSVAAAVAHHELKKVSVLSKVAKYLTSPTASGVEGGAATRLPLIGSPLLAASPYLLGAAAATAYGVDVYKSRNELAAHAKGALAMLGGGPSSMGEIERGLLGIRGNLSIGTGGQTTLGGKPAKGDEGMTSSAAASLSRILANPSLLTSSTVLPDDVVRALQQAVERGMASHVTEVHMDAVKLGQTLRRNPRAAREIGEAATANAQKYSKRGGNN